GQLVRRASNSISDAIAGTTFSLLAAEPGELIQVTVAQNADAALKSMQDFAAAYNAVRSWATTNSAPGAALAGSTALRTMASSLTSQLLQPVTGLASGWTHASFVGLQHDKNGVLSVDAAVFKAALASDPASLRRLFALSGETTDAELAFMAAGDLAQPSTAGYDVTITQAATVASVTGASWTTYSTAGAPDTMSVTDASTGAVGEIQIADG